jgi:hypothetical protein
MTTNLRPPTCRSGTLRALLGPAATGSFLAACLAACSLQDFSYLTREQGEAVDSDASQGPDANVDATSGSDAAADTRTSDGGVDAQPDTHDASAAIDAGPMGPDSTAPTDAGSESAAGPAPPALVNPSFEQAYSGWTFVPPSAMGKYAYTQYPPTGAYTIDGQYELATYSQTDSFTVSISQTLSNVPTGTYQFAGHFNCGVNNAAYIFSTNCGGPDQRANIPPTVTSTSWELISIDIDVTAGSCEVGFYVSASPTDWLNADAFTFTIAPPADGGSVDGGGE